MTRVTGAPRFRRPLRALCEEARNPPPPRTAERRSGRLAPRCSRGPRPRRDPRRAQAALGLAVVLDDLGDVSGPARRTGPRSPPATPSTGPRRLPPRPHLRAGRGPGPGRAAWRVVVDFGNDAYLPPAHLALARIADDAGEFDTAREHWEAAVATGDPRVRPAAAHDLAQRLLERGDPARAQRVLTAGLKLIDRAMPRTPTRGSPSCSASPTSTGDRRVRRGAGGGAADAEVGPLATELLARTLPLRGRPPTPPRSGAGPRRPRHRGPGPGAPAPRLRRGRRRTATPPAVVGAGVEEAVADGTPPALTGEVFGALDHMYALLAVRYAEPPAERLPGESRRCSAGRAGPQRLRVGAAAARELRRAAPAGDGPARPGLARRLTPAPAGGGPGREAAARVSRRCRARRPPW